MGEEFLLWRWGQSRSINGDEHSAAIVSKVKPGTAKTGEAETCTDKTVDLVLIYVDVFRVAQPDTSVSDVHSPHAISQAIMMASPPG